MLFCLGLLLLFRAEVVIAGTASIPPGTNYSETITVSASATNLSLQFGLQQGSGPLWITLCRTGDAACHSLTITDPTQTYELKVDESGNPPLNPGVYTLLIFNVGPDTAETEIQTTIMEYPFGPVPQIWENKFPVALPDLTAKTSSITVPLSGNLLAVEAGVRVAHPRVADLKFHLKSPQGTRVLLAANRGGSSAEGMGRDNLFTNTVPVSAEGGPSVYTNVINTGLLMGYVHIDWSFYALADRMAVYQGTQLIMDTGYISGSGSTNIAFGPGDTTLITLVMNPGDNPAPDTAWDYTVTYSTAEHVYAVVTGDTNKTLTPIAVASPPFTNANYIGPDPALEGGIFYMPEGSLSSFVGENARGIWQLEVEDTQAGNDVPSPVLLGWELRLVAENAADGPALLVPGMALTNTVAPGRMLQYRVDPPGWVTGMTNTLLTSNGLLRMWHNPAQPPTGTKQGDTLLLTGVQSGTAVIGTQGSPVLIPGSEYFLGIENTNSVPVTFAIELDLAVPFLTSNALVTGVLGTGSAAYFYYDVSPEETAVIFELSGLNTNADLLISSDTFPTSASSEYSSFNPGTNAEEIILTRNMEMNPLQTGRLYVGVIGPANASYTLKAIGYTNALPPIVTLFNAMPVAGTNNPVEGTNAYYRFVVSTNSLRAEFEVTVASGDVALVLQKGWPPPCLLDYDYLSNNPGTNDERIIVLDSSAPVPLTAGDWFATVVNASEGEVSYAIQAREWSARGTSIIVFPPSVSGDGVTLAWTSLPGLTYTLEGLPDLSQTNWTVVAPPVEATDYTASVYLGAPTSYQFFRVFKGTPATLEGKRNN